MKRPDPDDFIIIPRLEEYYRAGPVVGWGHAIPEGWRRSKQALKTVLPFVGVGVFYGLLLLNVPGWN